MSGDARGALQVVETHQQFWPGGALGEERDALRIRALLGAGDLVGARAALATFEARYPASIHLAALRTHASRALGAR